MPCIHYQFILVSELGATGPLSSMIQDVIESVVSQMHLQDNMPMRFIHATRDYANWEIDKKPLPIIVLDDMIDISFTTMQNGREIPVYSCLMLFLGKSDLRDTPTGRLPNMQRMLSAVQEFKQKLITSEFTFTSQPRVPVQNYRARTVYNYFDANTDGYIVTFEVELNNKGYDYCFAREPRSSTGGDFDPADFDHNDFVTT